MNLPHPHLIFFMDDFGTRTLCKPGDTLPMKPDVFSFGLGGIIVPSEAVQELSEKVKALCRRWKVPALHGNKIRAGKGKFGFVKKDAARRQTFLAELEAVIIDKRITAHACVICRPGYRDRYFERHAEPSRWQMSRTAFDIAVERAAKFAMTRDRRLSVVYERSGEREDRLLEAYFRGLLARGTEFDPGNASRHRPPVSTGAFSNAPIDLARRERQSASATGRSGASPSLPAAFRLDQPRL